ncbi:MAG: putative sugar nucleotidyl transferase [Cyclobacteriaceae bacterium]
MNLIFVDIPSFRDTLKPFTFTRPVSTIRVGIVTLGEKWQMRLDQDIPTSHITDSYLAEKYPLRVEADNLVVNPAVAADNELVDELTKLEPRSALYQGEVLVGACIPGKDLTVLAGYPNPLDQLPEVLAKCRSTNYDRPLLIIQRPWDIFLQNGEQIQADYNWLTRNRTSSAISDIHTRTYGEENIFVEEGVAIKAAIINAESGPVYLGENTTIHENAVIKGPFAMLEGAHVNIGAKIREATTIGPNSKVGGEVKNSVFQANSNKGHEGFVGNSVIGEWCNFGADTNTSNLKNNYQPIKLWDYRTRQLEDSGQTFCGLMMGDHSKCGINTMFNTGTVVGVFTNLFGGDFLPKFIPSFSWGGSDSLVEFRFEKAVEVLERVLARRNQTPNLLDLEILRHISQYRSSEFS